MSEIRKQKYETLLKVAASVIGPKNKMVSNMANLCALIKEHLGFFWIGFYFVDSEQRELYLGPFQGTLACTKIPYGKGVCGASWEQKKSLVVEDVHQFPSHIACSSLSNSEIVVPVFDNQEGVIAVLDIDSTDFRDFSELDREYLEKLVTLL